MWATPLRITARPTLVFKLTPRLSAPIGIRPRHPRCGARAAHVPAARLPLPPHSKYPPPNTHARAYADARAYAHTESRPRLQRDSSVDRFRDLHGRPARESERRHLRSQVVDSKPEPGDQLLR